MRETLKQHNLGNFSKSWKKNAKDLEKWTPYDFIIGVENVLRPPEPRMQEPQHRAQTGARELRHIDWEGLIHKVMHISDKLIGGDQERKDEILKGLEEIIENRGREIAEELMKQRNTIVHGWRQKLEKQDHSSRKGKERAEG
jgi:hypothetical protein